MVLSALAESAQVASLEIFRLAYPLRGRQASRVGTPCPRNGGGRPAGAGLVRAPRTYRVRGRLLGHRRRAPRYRGAADNRPAVTHRPRRELAAAFPLRDALVPRLPGLLARPQ